MLAARKQLLLKATGAALFTLAVATAFVGYLRPDMLVSFANAVMMCF
jgi:quinol-cytochrome oxidoreductase complex cytochrome b subunit